MLQDRVHPPILPVTNTRTLSINTRLSFFLPQPAHALLQLEAATIPGQRIVASETFANPPRTCVRTPGLNGIGQRMWLRSDGQVQTTYTAKVEVERVPFALERLEAVPLHALPAETTEYLFDSRYCQADPFHDFVANQFAGLEGGALVMAMQLWIAGNMAYEGNSSDSSTTAADSFHSRRGICRDFAHVLITMARAHAIPARYASCYSPGVSPPDFHAVAEVFLANPQGAGAGAWYMVDSTLMADPTTTVLIGVGRDAADVSFLTVFGAAEFTPPEVMVHEVVASI